MFKILFKLKILWIISFPDIFSLLIDIHLIFGTLLCHAKIQIMFEFGFDPFEFHEVMAHGLTVDKYSLHFCSPPPPLLALQSQIVTDQNLVWLCLNYFDWIYAGKGLGIACNALRMLVQYSFSREITFLWKWPSDVLIDPAYLEYIRPYQTVSLLSVSGRVGFSGLHCKKNNKATLS
jgi:hypothetical protein